MVLTLVFPPPFSSPKPEAQPSFCSEYPTLQFTSLKPYIVFWVNFQFFIVDWFPRPIMKDCFPYVCACTQSCPTLCGPMDCRPPGSSIHGILQAKVLKWVAISYSRGSSQSRDQTHVCYCLLHWQGGPLPLAPSGKPCFPYIRKCYFLRLSSLKPRQNTICKTPCSLQGQSLLFSFQLTLTQLLISVQRLLLPGKCLQSLLCATILTCTCLYLVTILQVYYNCLSTSLLFHFLHQLHHFLHQSLSYFPRGPCGLLHAGT